MPFLQGPAPIRRTLPYLESGKLIFRSIIKIMEVHYNMHFRQNETRHLIKYGNPHIGLRDFYFWYIPQIQYKNPNLQIVRFLEMTPTPFIRCWLDDGKDILVDCDSKSKEDILKHMIRIFGKSKKTLALEKSLKKQEDDRNPALFGFNQKRFCICEIPGQVPCSGTCQLPKSYLGLYTNYKKEELENWNNDLDAPMPTDKELETKFRWFPVPAKPILSFKKNIDKTEYGKPPEKQIEPTPEMIEFTERQKKLIE